MFQLLIVVGAFLTKHLFQVAKPEEHLPTLPKKYP